jgi:hypothetical protein
MMALISQKDVEQAERDNMLACGQAAGGLDLDLFNFTDGSRPSSWANSNDWSGFTADECDFHTWI